MIKMIKLNELRLSPLNPRTTEPSEQEIDALAASIQSIGLLQNLIVHPIDTKDRTKKQPQAWGVAGGGRRLRALNRLAKDGGGWEREIPCEVRDKDAAVAAVAENAARSPLNPVEEWRAYEKMILAGGTIDACASAFATTAKAVKQRLKLAKVHPEIIAAFEAGDLRDGVIEAFTLTDDTDRQLAIFKETGQPGWIDARSVRAKISGHDDELRRAAEFVGVEEYEAAGGKLTRDLFSETVIIDQPKKMLAMRDEKLEALAAEKLAEGWAWADTLTEQDWQIGQSFPARVYPVTGADMTEEEIMRYDELAETDEDEWTDDERAEWAELEAKADFESWPEGAKEVCGVVLWPDRGGKASVSEGFVKDEHVERAIELGLIQGGKAGTSAKPEAEKVKPAYSMAMMLALTEIRTLAVRTALLDKPELALDVLALDILRGSVLDHSYMAPSLPDPEAYGAVLISPYFERDHSRRTDDLANVQRNGKKARNAGIATSIARKLINQPAHTVPWFEQLFEASGADVRKVWTPNESFLKKLTKDQLVACAAEVGGTLEGVTKKGDIVARMVNWFAHGEQKVIGLEDRKLADAWLPEPMRAPAVEELEEAA